MHRSSFIEPITIVENSITESWFIPVDILMVMCTILTVICSALFLITIILDKTCHSVPMMLTANSCLAVFIWGCVSLAVSLITLENDLKQIQHQDPLCIYRAYFGYSTAALFYYSILLQTIYRYLIVVYPNHLIWQSRRVQRMFLCLAWLFCLTFPLAFIFSGSMFDIYNADNQIFQIPLRFSFSTTYGALCIYIIPRSMIMLIYLRLILYVRGMHQRIHCFVQSEN